MSKRTAKKNNPEKMPDRRIEQRAGKQPEKQKPSQGNTTIKKWSKKQKLVLLVAAAVLLVGGLVFAGVKIFGNHTEPEPVAEQPAEPAPEPEPEPKREVPPLEIPENIPEEERELAANYHVNAMLPRLISVPSVGIYARVVSLGKVNGVVDSPADPRIAGWYNLTQLPGAGGVTFFDGHGGNLGNGIFRGLENVAVGASIFVEMGDEETRYEYQVEEVVWQTKGAAADSYMSTALSAWPGAAQTISLVTCAGQWIPAEQTYTHRVFVRGTLLE